MLTKFIEGLQKIRDKFIIPGQSGDVCAEHDAITIWDVDLQRMTEFDVRELAELGFIPGTNGDVDLEETLAEHDLELSEEEYFDWERVTNEQWNILREELSSCMTYFC